MLAGGAIAPNGFAIRSTCDECSERKVKCDGKMPCSRCARKGVECFYRPRKARAKTGGGGKAGEAGVNSTFVAAGGVAVAPKPAFAATKGSKSESDQHAPASLSADERRVWSVFFTLYKSSSRCSSVWFSYQLRKMVKFLETSGNKGAEQSFKTWLEALNIVQIDLGGMVLNDEGFIADANFVSSVRFHFGEAYMPVLHNVDAILDVRGEAEAKGLPFFVIDESNIVTANPKFASTFGFDSAALTAILAKSGGGLLPWGGDVMARLLPNESDLLAFIQILAVKVNSLGKPANIPCVREIPSIHVFNILSSKSDIPICCLVKSLHREMIGSPGPTAQGVHVSVKMQIIMSFTPMASDVTLSTKGVAAVQTPPSITPSLTTQGISTTVEKKGGLYTDNIPSLEMPNVSSNDFFGDDEKWLGEMLEWASTSDSHTPDLQDLDTPLTNDEI